MSALSDRIRHLVERPDTILSNVLLEGETVYYDDAPSANAFFVGKLLHLVVLSVVSVPLLVWSIGARRWTATGAVMVVDGVVLLSLLIQRTREIYTRHVLTSFRVMRISGFLSRSNTWIPWVKVTDVRYEATILGRVLGYATLRIDSANEASDLKELKNLRNPELCEAALSRAVRSLQGAVDIGAPTAVTSVTPVTVD